jgi:hypothetical protein
MVAGEGLRLRAVEVRLSAKPEDGDVYPSPSGGGKLALSKNGLLKLSSAKGIVWDPVGSRMTGDAPACEACTTLAARNGRPPICPHNVGFRSVGAWLDPLGSWEVHSATKYWEWDAELAEVRRLYRKQVDEGKITLDQFEIKVQDEFHKRVRDRFSLAESKAMLRVIRQIGVKAAYSPAELAKSFLCPRVEPDISIEDARRRGMASAAQIFAAATASPLALPAVDFSHAVDHMNGDDAASEAEGDPAPETPTEEPEAEQQPAGQPEAAETVVCEDCGRDLAPSVLAFCRSPRGQELFGGAVFCFTCQEKHRGTRRNGGAR